MNIWSFYPGIENLGSSLGFLPPFMIGNQDIFSSLELVGKMGSSNTWCVLSSFFLISSSNRYMYNYLLISVVFYRSKIENQHREQVRAAPAFTRKIKDFDDLVNPRRLFD